MDKTHILIHHSATSDNKVLKDFDSIEREHISRGYSEIGYNLVVEQVNNIWRVFKGRPEWKDGAHCYGVMNRVAFGICVVGNYELGPPPEEVYKLVAQECMDYIQRYPTITVENIQGHRDQYATVCPGKFFDVSKVRNLTQQLLNEADTGKTLITIDIKGKLFPGYVTGGNSYFSNPDATDLISAFNNTWDWQEENLTVKVS